MCRKFICFIHIERAGGTTLHHLLHYNYPFYITLSPWYYWTNESGNHLTKEELKGLLKILPFTNGIGGHTTRTYACYEKVIKKPIFYFTFLREPISRYISHLNYQRQKMNIDWNVKDFINESRFNNYQVVRLAGKEDFEQAKKVLEENMDFVGLLEKFGESLILLREKLNDDRFSILYERKNLNKEKKYIIHFNELSDDIQQRITENNELDIKLYEYAVKNVYRNYVKEYSRNLSKDLKQFEISLKNYKYNSLIRNTILSYNFFVRQFIQPIPHKFCR